MSFQTKAIAFQLASLGVIATFGGARDEQVDGEINLSRGYSIQVGSSYLVLDRAEGEGASFVMYHGETREKLIDLFRDIAAVPELTSEGLEKFIADHDNLGRN